MTTASYFDAYENLATASVWGVVNEVVPHERALARGLELATRLAAKPDLYRRLQKQTLNQRLRRRIVEGVPYGMALEGSPRRTWSISRNVEHRAR